jgi:hypothetical protein
LLKGFSGEGIPACEVSRQASCQRPFFPRQESWAGLDNTGIFYKKEFLIMAYRNSVSRLSELSEAQALAINGGDGETPPSDTPRQDEDGKCDADSVGNYKVTSGQGMGTISECVAKEKKNGTTVYKWDVQVATFPK